MRYTIEGFSQEYAISLVKKVEHKGKEKEIRIDCTDLAILRWFVDFYPNMRKMVVDGRQYAMLSHAKLLSDMPILSISRQAAIDRMQKLVSFEILDYTVLKDGGTFSLYTFGENYTNLIGNANSKSVADSVGSTQYPVHGQPNTGYIVNPIPGVGSTQYPVHGQPNNKDSSIIDSSIIDSSIEDIYIMPQSATKKTTRFTPPALSEIADYCRERQNNIDPERFFDYYTANGWQVGKSKMKDWKAAVRTWEKNSNNTPKQQRPQSSGNPFLDMMQEESYL